MNIQIPDSWLREYLKTDAPPEKIKELLSLSGPSVERLVKKDNDFIYDVEITSNRVDTASVYGLAQEAKVILLQNKISAKQIAVKHAKEETKVDNPLPLEVKDPERLCERILAVVLDNVELGKSSPKVSSRLIKSGFRSLNNAIDITNYVMHELGHPCHVFDYDRIKTGKLIIRRAKKGESLTSLEGKKYELENEDVVIDDGTGRIVDLPGIIGTQNSVVVAQTKRVILFIESNNPKFIRRTSMRLGIRTQAAVINEKGPDPLLAKKALLRAVYLLEKSTGARRRGKVIDITNFKLKRHRVSISSKFIAKRLGVSIPEKTIISILENLQFKDVKKKKDKIEVTPPSYRLTDIKIAEDLVEEIARIYGYHNLPGKIMTGKIPEEKKKPKIIKVESRIKNALKYWGYNEVYNYSFISKKQIKKAGLDIKSHLRVKNSLTEDIEYMRTTLTPSLFSNISDNQNRSSHLSLFELAHVYKPAKKRNQLPREIPMLSLATTKDYLVLKGTVESLLLDLGINYKFKFVKDVNKFMHPKNQLGILSDNKHIGTLGFVNPLTASKFAIDNDITCAEINVLELKRLYRSVSKFEPIPSHPPVFEDITLVIGEKIHIGELIDRIYNLSPLVKKVSYIGSYKNSHTIRLKFHHKKRNLTQKEINNLRKKIESDLKKQFGIDVKRI